MIIKTGKFRIHTSFSPGTFLILLFISVPSINFAQFGHLQSSNWFKITMMPDTASGFSLNEVDGKLYLIGGEVYHPDSGLSKVSIYDIERDEWTLGARMPTPRYPAANVTIGDNIYAIGGNKCELISGNKMEVYNVSTDTWSTVADVPTSRVYPAACVLDGKIYVIGGSSQSTLTVPCGSQGAYGMSNVERYDPVANVWDTVAPMPTARFSPAASVINGKIYVMGGAKPFDEGYGSYATVEEYDPVTDQWSTKASMSYPRNEFSGLVVMDKIWAIGGAPSAGFRTVYPHFEIYDPVSDSWILKSDVEDLHPQALAATRAINVHGRIYIVGGFGAKTHTHPIYRDVYAYNFPTMTISSEPVVSSADSLEADILKDCKICIVPAGTPAKPDSIFKDSLIAFNANANANQEFSIPLDHLSPGTYRSYAVASDGLVDLNSFLFRVADEVPEFIVRVKDNYSNQLLPVSYVYLNGKRFTQSSEEGAVLTGWGYDTCSIKVTADGYFDFDTTIVLNSDLDLTVYLQNIYSPAELTVTNKPIIATSAGLYMKLSEKGSIYVVPEGTPAVEDSIIQYALETYRVEANVQLEKPTYVFPVGKYIIYGVYQGLVSPNHFRFRLVEHVPEYIIQVMDQDSKEIIAGSEMVLNAKDTIPESDLGFELTGWAYDTCALSISHVEHYGIDTTIVVLKDSTHVIYLSLINGVELRELPGMDIQIYPNPVSDQLTVVTKNMDWYEISLTSINGQVVNSRMYYETKQQIDMTPYAAGVYFIKIRSKDAVVIRKVIRQ